MRKRMYKVTSLILISSMCLAILFGCAKGINSKKAIENGEIYPIGEVKGAKLFDEQRRENEVDIKATDIDFIIAQVKKSEKEVVTEYDSDMELHITFADSTLQIIRENEKSVYYVYHDGKINGICYQVHSQELAEWLLHLMNDVER